MASQTAFDIWDVIVSEMVDTIVEGFKGHRQLYFAHWICFILRTLLAPLPDELCAVIRDTPTIFPVYNMSQLVGAHPSNRATREPHQRPVVPEIEEQ